jgi:MFS family permease
MGLYIIFLYGGNSVMPLISGFVIDRAGWRWFCWLCGIISCLNFLAIFFFVEETRFERGAAPLPQLACEQLPEKLTANDTQEQHLEKANITTTENSPTTVDAGSELTGIKKSYLQTLSLWSGTSEQSFFSHFMRPYLMIVYPAVIWATITCKWCLCSVSHAVLTDLQHRLAGACMADQRRHSHFLHISSTAIRLVAQFERLDQYPGNDW